MMQFGQSPAPGGENLEALERRRKLAEMMVRESQSYAPVQHWTQGAARLAQGAVGNYNLKAVNAQDGQLRQGGNDALLGLMNSTPPPQQPAPAPVSSSPPPDRQKVVDALAGPKPMAYDFSGAAQAEMKPVQTASLDPQLVSSVKKFEGYEPTAKWDYKQHSGGYGTPAQPGETFTPEKADARLNDELMSAQAIVERAAPNAPPGVKKALTSLTFNAGDDWVRSGLGAAIRNGDYQTAQQKFQQYVNAGGKPNRGLINRRQQEAQWFREGGDQQQQSQPQAQPQDQMRALLNNPYTQSVGQKLILDQYQRNQPLSPREQAKFGNDYSKQPIYGTDADGNPVVMQVGPRGEAVRTQLPEGVNISKAPIKLDAGTEYIMLDPITRQPVARIPKDIAGEESAKAQGKMQGEAAASLPSAITKADTALDTIQNIRTHPGREYGLGAAGVVPGVPGTQQRGFVNLVEQAKGQAFLQAFESLKGGGAITEIEGQKASAAIARLDRAQTPQDFDRALDDLQTIILQGKENARRKAGAAPISPGPGQQPPASPTAQRALPKSQQDYDALPSGAEFQAPDGTIRRKP